MGGSGVPSSIFSKSMCSQQGVCMGVWVYSHFSELNRRRDPGCEASCFDVLLGEIVYATSGPREGACSMWCAGVEWCAGV